MIMINDDDDDDDGDEKSVGVPATCEGIRHFKKTIHYPFFSPPWKIKKHILAII